MTDRTRKIAQVLAGCLVAAMVSLSSAISAPASKPQLGCYRVGAEKGPSYVFCLRERGILVSQTFAGTEGFGSCGKFHVWPGSRLEFWWAETAEGAFIHNDDWKKPGKIVCKWSVAGKDSVVLTDCSLAATWEKVPEDTRIIGADDCDLKK